MSVRRIGLAILLLLASAAALVPVLYVNNGLELLKTKSTQNLGAPRIQVHVEDSCNWIRFLQATVEATPYHLNISIDSTPSGRQTCKAPPSALFDIVNLTLRLADGTAPPQGYSFPLSPHAAYGVLHRADGQSTNFVIHLKGDGSAPEGVFAFTDNALNVGFGESAAQIELSTRDLQCPPWDPQTTPERIESTNCLIPLQGVLQYATSASDLISATPPIDRFTVGPNVMRSLDKPNETYATTRLVWSGKVRPSDGYIPVAMTGFEFHLIDRNSAAQRQFITVAFSALFGTFISMLFTLPSLGLNTSGETGPGELKRHFTSHAEPHQPPPVMPKPPEQAPSPSPVGPQIQIDVEEPTKIVQNQTSQEDDQEPPEAEPEKKSTAPHIPPSPGSGNTA